jgi:hypothetical protein
MVLHAAAVVAAFAFHRLRSGPFEGPATVKPPALPEDTYFVGPENPVTYFGISNIDGIIVI